jgi:hypothetical protein
MNEKPMPEMKADIKAIRAEIPKQKRLIKTIEDYAKTSSVGKNNEKRRETLASRLEHGHYDSFWLHQCYKDGYFTDPEIYNTPYTQCRINTEHKIKRNAFIGHVAGYPFLYPLYALKYLGFLRSKGKIKREIKKIDISQKQREIIETHSKILQGKPVTQENINQVLQHEKQALAEMQKTVRFGRIKNIIGKLKG